MAGGQSKTDMAQGQEKISSRQLSFLVVTFVIATADVLLPAYVAQDAGPDSWLCVVAAAIFCFAATFLMLALGMKYPGKTIIRYSCDILGKPLGKIAGFLYVFYFFYIGAGSVAQLNNIYISAFNPEVPPAVIGVITLLVAFFAVSKGIEAISRVNEILLPFGLGILALIAMANIPNSDLNNYRPVLADGIAPVLKGAFVIQGWLLEVSLILQLIPFVKDKGGIKKGILISIAVLSSGMQLGVLTLAVFGPLTAKFLFPALEYVRFASLGKFINNLDISIIGLWIAGIFIKISAAYYAAASAVSQLFGFKSYRRILAPLGLMIIAQSANFPERIPGMLVTTHYIFPFFSLSMGFLLPAALFAASFIKDRLLAGKNISA